MKVNEILKKNSIIPIKYETRGKSNIITTKKGIFVYKNGLINRKIYNYLLSRNFDYIPPLIDTDFSNYCIHKYIESYDLPDEQKALDMIDTVALLHSKTTHYKELDQGDIMSLNEDIENNIKHLESYYNDIMTIIESKVYMSPAEYLLARNINTIFSAIQNSKKKLKDWYEIASKKEKTRKVINHGNLTLEHFIRNKKSYLISWDKAKIDSPVMDLYKLYKNNFLNLDFSEILKRYEKNYPLLEEEKALFSLLISLPDIPKFKKNNYENTKNINKIISFIYKSKELPKEFKT